MGFFKSLLKIAKVVAPIALSFALPGVGTAIGGALGVSAATGGAIASGALGAGLGSLDGGGVKGALLGGATGAIGGYAGGGGFGSIIGEAGGAGTLNGLSGAGLAGQAAADAASGFTGAGSGILGSLGSTGNLISNGVGAVRNGLTSLIPGSGGSAAAGGASGGNPLLSLANIAGGIYSAQTGAAAANNAAQQQAQAAQNAINAQQNSLTQIRGDLQPFRDAGSSTVGGLTQLVNNPTAQTSFIQNNPFYASLAEDAKNKLFSNEAARGKVGSGGTAAALQNSLLLLGSDLLNQNITQKQNLATLGSNAAAQTGTATQNAALNTTGLLTDQGNAGAAGTIGAYNAKTGAINNALGTATNLYGIQNGIQNRNGVAI